MVNWIYVILLFILGFVTYYRKSLDVLGSVVMIVMGIIIIFSAGANWLLLIALFLIMSLLATKFSNKYQQSLSLKEGELQKMLYPMVLWPVSWLLSEVIICRLSAVSLEL